MADDFNTISIEDATYTPTIDDLGYVIGYRSGVFSRWKITDLQGADGVDGSQVYVLTVDPTDVLGNNGDVCINVTTGNVFKKAAYVWGTAVGTVKGTPGVSPNEYVYSFSGSLSVRTGRLKKYINTAHTIVKVVILLGTTATGASLKLDICKNGISNSIFSSGLEVPDGQASLTVTSIDNPSLVAGDYLTMNITQIGSTTAGADLSVAIIME